LNPQARIRCFRARESSLLQFVFLFCYHPAVVELRCLYYPARNKTNTEPDYTMRMRIKTSNWMMFLAGFCALAASAFWVADAVQQLNVRQARDLIQHIAGADLKKDQVQIKSISGGVGSGGVIVRAQIETSFRFTQDEDGWRIADVRLGDRQWESFELIEEAVRREKIRRTNAMLKVLAEGIDSYRSDHAQFAITKKIDELLDFLSPRYLKTPHRFDLWGEEFEYRGSATAYRLISSGPDRKSGNEDDLVVENGKLKTAVE
jgi:hypothetical protein